MNEQRDYSLLRPFDLEAAKAGALLGDAVGSPTWKYAAGPDSNGNISVIIIKTGLFAEPSPTRVFKMAPLCWVEGRPAYKGDVLYRPGIDDGPVVASHIENVDGDDYLVFEGSDRDEFADNRRGYMTWAEPNPVLCEVEGKPVRKGDRLWSNYFKVWFAVTEIEDGFFVHERRVSTPATSCSWKRKVKKQGFINIYPPAACHGTGAVASVATTIYPNKGMADALMALNRIACLQVEWEEEVSE